jgi:hypothetical protein
MEDKNNFIETEKPAEIVEIEEAQEAIREVLWWKKRLDWTGWIFYAIGFFMWAILDNERSLIVVLMALSILVFSSTVLNWRLLKRRMICQDLLDAFTRKKALPLYHEMLEKFADQPHLHIHLSENGTIVITDRRTK